MSTHIYMEPSTHKSKSERERESTSKDGPAMPVEDLEGKERGVLLA